MEKDYVALMDTLDSLQTPLAETARAVEDHRGAFFANPNDIETNHHFRTNIRRLRSLLWFIRPWQKKDQNTEAQAILKSIVGHTSLLRELDVFQAQVRSNPDSSPELIALCRDEASLERARVIDALASRQVTESFHRAMALTQHVTWKKHFANCGLPRSMVRSRYDAMIDSFEADLEGLDLRDAENTHHVRKRAKRVRYVAELNADVLGADTVDVAKGMTAHQDDLGDICDARANIRLIEMYLRQDLPEPIRNELIRIRETNESCLNELIMRAGG